jgi:magnesium-transporting ATPase (P-type)
MLRVRATVARDGAVRELDAEEIVPGDVVWLESGNRVPADLRLFSAHGLQVDESLLTGETLPVTKDSTWRGEASTPVGERRAVAYAGSIVVRGRGKAVAVATGTNTMVGRLALDVVGTAGTKPPLLIRMERFNRVVAGTIFGAATVVAIIGVVGHHRPVIEMLFFAIALAVAAIPEGLPAALTIT